MNYNYLVEPEQRSAYPVTICLPLNILKKIDGRRHDINRSKYMLRLLEKALEDKNK